MQEVWKISAIRMYKKQSEICNFIFKYVTWLEMKRRTRLMDAATKGSNNNNNKLLYHNCEKQQQALKCPNPAQL